MDEQDVFFFVGFGNDDDDYHADDDDGKVDSAFHVWLFG